jgi:RNA:NAD 2'-phosphotransferase (TPT1/KptA family)
MRGKLRITQDLKIGRNLSYELRHKPKRKSSSHVSFMAEARTLWRENHFGNYLKEELK